MVLPFVNASGAPLASERVEALLTTSLKRKRVGPLEVYALPREPDAPPELEDQRRFRQALMDARAAGIPYGITGTVVKWGYRPYFEDEPDVRVSLRVVDVSDGRILWSGTGASMGRGTVAAAAQVLLQELTAAMPLDPPMTERASGP